MEAVRSAHVLSSSVEVPDLAWLIWRGRFEEALRVVSVRCTRYRMFESESVWSEWRRRTVANLCSLLPCDSYVPASKSRWAVFSADSFYAEALRVVAECLECLEASRELSACWLFLYDATGASSESWRDLAGKLEEWGCLQEAGICIRRAIDVFQSEEGGRGRKEGLLNLWALRAENYAKRGCLVNAAAANTIREEIKRCEESAIQVERSEVVALPFSRRTRERSLELLQAHKRVRQSKGF